MSAGPRTLDAYRSKRDPTQTPEPFGGRRATGSRLFVVQKHAARRLHYDLRLEMDGVLKSWAVPKGPSVRHGERRLAVHVEDHPVEYADFEGVIPRDNYGAGSVIVWDQGWYRLSKGEDPLRELARGKIEFELHGMKLRGRWTLARMGGRHAEGEAPAKDWLLLKAPDAYADAEEPVERAPESIFSGLTVEEIGGTSEKRAALDALLASLDAPIGEVTARRQPLMLATLTDATPTGPGWLFEIKYDGVRVLAERDNDTVTLYGRKGDVVSARYPEVTRALRALPVSRFVIDGEIVALGEDGRPSFQRLQARMHLTRADDIDAARAAVPATGIFFDCLALEGRDLRRRPLLERKRCLELVLPARGVVRYCEHVAGGGAAFFDAVGELGLEGVVAKRAASLYGGGRSRDWLKVKCQRRQEFVIGGYTVPQGSRGHFGALHLGLYEEDRLAYVSKVGTGFDAGALAAIAKRLAPLARATTPFAAGSPTGRGHHWVEPRLVCKVRFTDWTAEGGIRHPTFLGLRDDRRPEECRRERPFELPPAEAPAPAAGGEGDAPPPSPVERQMVKITNPKKVFWPSDGYTKADLVAYYETVAPHLLPYLRDRPLVLTRYPDGITGKSFFQKDAPDFAPAWIRTERIYSHDTERDIDYFVVDDVESLRYVANLGTIPLHFWSARTAHLDRPDWLVLDLDPKGAPFTDVVAVARTLRRILERFDLPSHVKTSGATGLHILVPLGARYTHEEARTFARLLATLGVEAAGGIATIARPIRARGGKVYIDFGQNGHGRTIVAPYSVRPRPGAPVSCPLRWDEVTAKLDPARFTITTAPARFARMRDPLAPILTHPGIDLAGTLARLAAGPFSPPGG
jgi:bifunctional non-homologous end joining protein LigD